MNRTLKIYLAAVVGVIVLLVFVDSLRTKPLDWNPTYSLDEKKPLDLYVFNQEVEKLFPKGRFRRVTVTPYEYIETEKKPCSYLIINQNIYQQVDSILLNEVAKGSTLWLSGVNFDRKLTDTLHLEYADVDPDISLKTIDSVKLTLSMSNWGSKAFYLHPVHNAFSFTSIDSSATILGKMEMANGNVFPNYVRVKFGKGTIFLHNQPSVFSNHGLLSAGSCPDYVAHLLSYLPKDKPVVWLVKNQTVKTGAPINESALSVVFRYPALRMAWLLFLYGLLLYLLFNAKRRQRVIPIIKPLKNTTVEFVQSIGNLYFQEGSTRNIYGKKIIYFLDRLRNRYHLDTSRLDESFAASLHAKSGKDKALIDAILTCIRDFQKLRTAIPTDLIKLNSLIEEFWKEESFA